MELNTFKELGELIEVYGLNKTEYDAYKELCDKENKEIKELMSSENLKNYESENFKVSYSVSERTSFDEDKMIAVIKSFNLPDSLGLIKTREYIDEDALESSIYSGLIPDDVLEKIKGCMTTKEVETVRLTKKGEKK
jgi:hypothetical protein